MGDRVAKRVHAAELLVQPDGPRPPVAAMAGRARPDSVLGTDEQLWYKPTVICFHCLSSYFNAFSFEFKCPHRGPLRSGGNPRDAKPPLLPGEQVGCCLRNRTIHRRYTDAGLPDWARGVAANGSYDVGYYTRTLGWDNSARLTANVSWFKTWLANMRAAGGNAQYVDQFARTHNGKPSEVLKLFEQDIPPANVITEGWSDYMPFAGQSWLHALLI
eukprot:SAG22_NODE_4769_length_1169_cov_0.988785_2_plen_216_part_00